MTSTDPYVFPSATTPNTNPCSKIPPGLLTYRHDPADRGDPCQPIDQGAQLADSKRTSRRPRPHVSTPCHFFLLFPQSVSTRLAITSPPIQLVACSLQHHSPAGGLSVRLCGISYPAHNPLASTAPEPHSPAVYHQHAPGTPTWYNYSLRPMLARLTVTARVARASECCTPC